MDAAPTQLFSELDDAHILEDRSPVRPPCLDYDPMDYQIRPCSTCGTWWAELVREPDGRQVVREWHDPACPVLTEWS